MIQPVIICVDELICILRPANHACCTDGGVDMSVIKQGDVMY